MITINNDSTDPYFNLAVEETLLNAPSRISNGATFEEPILLLWQNAPTVVVGVHQNALEEIDATFVEERKIRVARRSTGRAAVYHDLGNLNYSFVVPDSPNFLRDFYRRFADGDVREEVGDTTSLSDSFRLLSRPIVDVLHDWNVPAETSGRNDVVVAGKKISGSAQVRKNGRTLHHGTLLFDANLDDVSRALKADPSKFRSKAVASVRARVGNLVDFLSDELKVDAISKFKEALKERLSRTQTLVVREFTVEEKKEIERLRDEKYSTWNWNFGESPRFQIRNARRFDWGKIEIAFDVEKGRVARAQIFGDFFESSDLAPLLARIVGAPFERDELISRFTDEFLRRFLPQFSQKDFLELLFKR